MIESIDAQWGERGTYVANGPGALQAAVDAAAPDTKLLVGSGDYQEEVLVATNGIHLVGCGAATDQRPQLIPPATETNGRGIRAFNNDRLLFQSLKTFGHRSDGIFISGAQGVVFRDIVGDGNDVSRYAVFPVRSNDVTIELCRVTRIADAGVYVGQSATLLVRHNDVRDSVAGTEFENSANGVAYGNYATNNTAGMLVFKDPGLPVQYSQCHDIHHNLFESNNHENFGTGTVGGVPEGTGFLVIGNDTTPFDYNIARGHNTFGYAMISQTLAGFDPPFSDDPEPDQNFIFSNIFDGNGLAPDVERSSGIGGDVVSISTRVTNCQNDNVFTLELGFAALPACALPVPAFDGCPAAPVTRP
jgi:parallel beta-helix repeat protein